MVAKSVVKCDTANVPASGFETSHACWLSLGHGPHPPEPQAAPDGLFVRLWLSRCQHTAIVLALRGQSLDRAFLTVGTVESARVLELVANLFGDMLAFIDVNIFFTGNDLRTQADTFVVKVCHVQPFENASSGSKSVCHD